jgi:hypothetical protein
MQAEFYAAETLGEDSDSVSTVATSNTKNMEKMYRDILLNLKPHGSDCICEVQVTLTGISILKKSEQKIYSVTRMKSAEELKETSVYSAPHDSMPDVRKGADSQRTLVPGATEDEVLPFSPVTSVACQF